MRKHILFNVAEYIRLSREDGDKAESDSIGNQRKLITDYLKDKDDFVLYDTYIDDGFTGTNFKRPSFKRMIADIEAGKVNCVITLTQENIWNAISRIMRCVSFPLRIILTA